MAFTPTGPGARSPGAPPDGRARDEDRRKNQRRQEQVADACGAIEEDLERLRTRYELYFMGVERREPARERDEMRRTVSRLKSESATVNTGLRFRIDTLHARFLSYERMWLRSAREKEEGTYRRDLARLRRKAQGAPAEAPEAAEPRREDRTAAPPPPEPPKRAAAPAQEPPAALPESPPAAGLTPAQLQTLYAAYVDAKRRCNEDVSKITYEALARTVARQVPEILARYKAASVEFRVVIKDGRALLKALPRT